MADIVFVKDYKLREPSKLTYCHEANNIKNLKFTSELERVQYLNTCKSNCDTVDNLLNDCNALVAKFDKDGLRGPIAQNVLSYAEICLNNALQMVQNCTLQSCYLTKITAHVRNFIKLVEELDTGAPLSSTRP